MNNQIKIFFAFIAIWFCASIINGVLCGICFGTIETFSFVSFLGIIIASIIGSFIISIPFVTIVWVITIIGMAFGKKGFSLFQISLITTLVISILGAFIFIQILGKEFIKINTIVGICIVFSAMGSVLICRKKIKSTE